MRLTCPRCRAQYEIADGAIPASGRSVECSTCGHVWRQPGRPAAAEAAMAVAQGHGAQGSGVQASRPGHPGTGHPATAAGHAGAGHGEAGPSWSDYDPAQRPPLHRPLDESILSVLREEAGRELGARRGTAGPQAGARPRRDGAATASDVASRTLPPDLPEPAAPSGPGGGGRAAARAASPAAGMLDDPPTPAPAQAPPDPGAALRDRSDPPVAARIAPEAPRLPDAAALAATLIAGPGPARPPAPEDEVRPALAPDPAAPARPAAMPASDAPQGGPAAGGPVVPQGRPIRVDVPQGRDMAGYGLGLGLAAMLALGVVAFYAVAPRLAPDGTGTIAEWRAGLDEARLWLRTRLEALRDAGSGGSGGSGQSEAGGEGTPGLPGPAPAMSGN